MSATLLYEMGYTDLVSVIPVNATLSPGSAIGRNQLGKVPGRKLANGTWAGYNWRTHEPTIDDVRSWQLQGASIGLRAKRFLGLDVDSLNETVASIVEEHALRILGPAPIRVGRAPKRLLMYRIKVDSPFITRMRLFIELDGVTHLIELLGDGQQFLVEGTHPGTLRPYEWVTPVPPAADLTPITREQVEQLFAALTVEFEKRGAKVTREGSGNRAERVTATDQDGLRAPSMDALREAVALIPNTNDLFPTREDYIRMGYAIRAASGDDVDTGYDVFSEWAQRWDGGVNEPETVASDWRRMRGPYAIGWTYIAEIARGYGYNTAADEFPVDGEPPTVTHPVDGEPYSDRWLADHVLVALSDTLRYVPATGRWLVWDGSRWVPDTLLRAHNTISRQLVRIARELRRTATTAKEQGLAAKESRRIESLATLENVIKLVRSDPIIALSPDALDADPWSLNTPAGTVDLRTGELAPTRPESLSTKLTRVGPDFGGPCPEWRRFLAEATGGNQELERYLQRYAGYCLTGVTIEQVLVFLYGPGGNGKGCFVNAVRDVMGDYARVAPMDTFTASSYDRHTTDLADLMGARMVTASETQSGRRWDEQRVKQLSGGDPITARFMRQDNFTYQPQFKLLFLGNHMPQTRDIDPAIKRRLQLVPFMQEPAQIDLDLPDKLKLEYPAILAWCIEGCLMWQAEGLQPPKAVKVESEMYFEAQDALGRWAEECIEAAEGETETMRLFESWREWCGRSGEYVGSVRRFAQALRGRRYDVGHATGTRRSIVRGVQLKDVVTFP